MNIINMPIQAFISFVKLLSSIISNQNLMRERLALSIEHRASKLTSSLEQRNTNSPSIVILEYGRLKDLLSTELAIFEICYMPRGEHKKEIFFQIQRIKSSISAIDSSLEKVWNDTEDSALTSFTDIKAEHNLKNNCSLLEYETGVLLQLCRRLSIIATARLALHNLKQ